MFGTHLAQVPSLPRQEGKEFQRRTVVTGSLSLLMGPWSERLVFRALFS